MNDEQNLTIGEYRVGKSFNPSADPKVDQAKAMAAALIDLCDTVANSQASDNKEVRRLTAIAMTHFEEGAMNLVKAITKPALPASLAQ